MSQSKRVLIPGVSSGIGLAAARRFADVGYEVVGTARTLYHLSYRASPTRMRRYPWWIAAYGPQPISARRLGDPSAPSAGKRKSRSPTVRNGSFLLVEPPARTASFRPATKGRFGRLTAPSAIEFL